MPAEGAAASQRRQKLRDISLGQFFLMPIIRTWNLIFFSIASPSFPAKHTLWKLSANRAVCFALLPTWLLWQRQAYRKISFFALHFTSQIVHWFISDDANFFPPFLFWGVFHHKLENPVSLGLSGEKAARGKHWPPPKRTLTCQICILKPQSWKLNRNCQTLSHFHIAFRTGLRLHGLEDGPRFLIYAQADWVFNFARLSVLGRVCVPVFAVKPVCSGN